MRQGLMAGLLLWTWASLGAQTLSVGSATGQPGSGVTVPVDFSAGGGTVALQFDVLFDPAAVSLGNPQGGGALADHVVVSSLPSPGVRRVLIYSLTNSALSSGTLVSLPVTIDPAAELGRRTLSLSGVVGSDAAASAVPPLSLNPGQVSIGDIRGRVTLALSVLEGPAAVTLGDEIRYTFQVANQGLGAATGLTVRALLAAGASLLSAEAGGGSCAQQGREVLCQLGGLPAGESLAVTLVLKVARAGEIVSRVEVDSEQGETPESARSLDVMTRVVPLLLFPAGLEQFAGGLPAMARSLFEQGFVGLSLFNPNPAQTVLDFSARDREGMAGAEPQLAALEPGRQRVLLLRELLQDPRAGVVLVGRGQSAPIQGLFLVGASDLGRLDGVNGNLAPAEVLYFPALGDAGQGEATLLFLHNPDSQAETDLTLELFGSDGTLLGSRSRTLGAEGSLVGGLGQLFEPLEIPADGYLKVSGERALQGFALLAGRERLEAVAGRLASLRKRLLAAHFFVQPGGDTVVRFLNADTLPARVELRALDDGGSVLGAQTLRLAAGASGSLRLSSLLGEGSGSFLSGSLEAMVDSDSGRALFSSGARVLGTVEYRGERFASRVAMVGEGERNQVFLDVAQSLGEGIFTGLALLNSASEAAAVTVEAFDPEGMSRGRVELTLPAGGRLADLLASSTFLGENFEQLNGRLEVHSSQPLVALLLIGDYDQEFLTAVPAQPLIGPTTP